MSVLNQFLFLLFSLLFFCHQRIGGSSLNSCHKDLFDSDGLTFDKTLAVTFLLDFNLISLIECMVLQKSYNELLGNSADKFTTLVDDWHCTEFLPKDLSESLNTAHRFDHLEILTFVIQTKKQISDSDKSVHFRNFILQQRHLLSPNRVLIQRPIESFSDAVRHQNSYHNLQEVVDSLRSFHH